MSNDSNQSKIVVRPIRRDEPDLRRLARALIDLAIQQSEQEAAEVEDKAESEEAA